MAIGVKSSFSAGELDPALWERTTLDKYASGMATARNVVIGKTGRVLSRHGRRFIAEAKYEAKPVRIHTLRFNDEPMYFEFGVGYIKLYDSTGTLVEQGTHSYNADDIPKIQFVNHAAPYSSTGAPCIMIFCKGKEPLMYAPVSGAVPDILPFFDPFTFYVPALPAYYSSSIGGTGYDLDYAFTVVRMGLESAYVATATGKLPQNAGELNQFVVTVAPGDGGGLTVPGDNSSEVRVYRRPRGAGAFGYIGSTTSKSFTSLYFYTFTDFGQSADYTHSPPTANPTIFNGGLAGPQDFQSATGAIYQQRMIISSLKGIEASRIGQLYSFTRDYPYGSDSSLSFSGGSKGSHVLWIIENEGMIVFQSDGIYLNSGALTPSNLALDRKGGWVIDELVPPIAIPGGVLFVDKATNTVRELRYSLENGSYVGEELSIFSNHLFEEQKITSWAFMDGPFPLLWVTFNNGKFATFTYEREHQMRAWTRHDSGVGIESVATLQNIGVDSTILFVTTKGDKRFIEQSLPRYVSPLDLADNPEADKWDSMPAMDSVVSWRSLINDLSEVDDVAVDTSHLFVLSPIVAGDWFGQVMATVTDGFFASPGYGAVGQRFRFENPDVPFEYTFLTVVTHIDNNNVILQPDVTLPFGGAATFTTAGLFHVYVKDFLLTPQTPNVWDGVLNLTCYEANIFQDPGPGTVGQVFRWFNPIDRTSIDLLVISRTDDNNIVVEPSLEFPSEYASNPRLYLTKATFDGLDHMEGENVAVISDGYVMASPNNTIDEYPTVTVTGGQITLPSSLRGAIVHVGRPYVMDIETLDINTVEQRPVLIESKTVNKVYVKTHKSRGLFIGSRFPINDTPAGSDVTGTEMVKMDGIDAYEVDYEQENPITGNRYDQPTTRRLEIMLPGDWKSQGRICIRQVDPLHFEILSIIPDLDDQRRG